MQGKQFVENRLQNNIAIDFLKGKFKNSIDNNFTYFNLRILRDIIDYIILGFTKKTCIF